jgi:hypothetical protein
VESSAPGLATTFGGVRTVAHVFQVVWQLGCLPQPVRRVDVGGATLAGGGWAVPSTVEGVGRVCVPLRNLHGWVQGAGLAGCGRPQWGWANLVAASAAHAV